jgi:hypothetical protein
MRKEEERRGEERRGEKRREEKRTDEKGREKKRREEERREEKSQSGRQVLEGSSSTSSVVKGEILFQKHISGLEMNNGAFMGP